MKKTLYIGAKCVPSFYIGSGGSSEWISGVPFEPLTVVTYNNTWFISKKPVPAGAAAPQAGEYWAQVPGYVTDVTPEELQAILDDIEDLQEAVGDLDDLDTTAKTNLVSAVNEVKGETTELRDDLSDTKDFTIREIASIVDENLIYNSSFSLEERVPSGSGTYKNVYIEKNISVSAGDVVHVDCDVSATVTPAYFASWLKIAIIQYDSNNTVVTRNFDMTVPIVISADVTHLDFIVSYSYSNVPVRYTEIFIGYIRAWIGKRFLDATIEIGKINDVAETKAIYVSDFVLGGIGIGGIEITSTSRIRSGFIKVNKGCVISLSDYTNYNLIIYQYDFDKNYVSRDESWRTTDETINADRLIRILIRKSDNSDISLSDVTTIASTAKILFTEIPRIIFDNVNDIKAEISNFEVKEIENLKYNDMYYADGILRRVYNPYKDKGSTVLNGQLHCHIRYLDGDTIKYYNNGDMATAMQNYRSSGYDFLTITDYGYIGEITAPTDQQLPSGLIWMFDSCEAPFSGSDDGEEKPPRHMCVYNTDTPLSYQNNWMSAQDFADLMKPTGKIITLAHPFYSGTYQKPSVVAQIEERVRFCEVYNGLCAWHQAQGDNWIITPTGKDTDYAWETMLDNGLVVWGTSVSDAHSTTGISAIKNGCVKVFCESGATRFDILKNLCLGKFYAVSNIDVNLTDVSFTDGVYSVSVTDANAVIEFIKEGGTVLSTTTGSTASYTMTGSEKYVRARITLSNGEKIWTQPVINIFKPDYDNYFEFSLAE